MGRNVSLNILQQRTRICHILTMLVLIVAALAVSNDHTQAQAPVDAVTTDTSITLSWTADGEVHFFWYQPKTKQTQVVSVTDGKSHTITGLAPKSVHKFSFFGAFFGTLVVTTNADSNPPPPPPPPTPEVSIAAGNDITEGGTASFTLTANPAPTASITVSVSHQSQAIMASEARLRQSRLEPRELQPSVSPPPTTTSTKRTGRSPQPSTAAAVTRCRPAKAQRRSLLRMMTSHS